MLIAPIFGKTELPLTKDFLVNCVVSDSSGSSLLICMKGFTYW